MISNFPIKRFLLTTGQFVLFLSLLITGLGTSEAIRADINTHEVEAQNDVTVYLGNVQLETGDTLFFEIALPTTEFEYYMEGARQRGVLNISLGGVAVKEVPWNEVQDVDISNAYIVQVFFQAATAGTYGINITKLQGLPVDFVFYKNLSLERVDDFTYQTVLNFLLIIATIILGLMAAVHFAMKSSSTVWAAQLMMPYLMVIFFPIAYLAGTISPSFTNPVAGRGLITCTAANLGAFWIWEGTLLCYLVITTLLTIRERRLKG